MASQSSPVNVVSILQLRELGGTSRSNCIRRDLSIVRNLSTRGKTVFRKVWQKSSKSPVLCEGNRLYFDNYRTCYSNTGVLGIPRLLYELPVCQRSCKIEDALMFSATPESLPLPQNGHELSLIIVTANHWLRRLHLQTGNILEEVYLSQKYKFKDFGWLSDQQRFYLKSTSKSTHSVRRPAGNPACIVRVLAIFDICPLEFVGMLEIDKQIFGHDVSDVTMSLGLLITLHHSGHIRLYSFEKIVQQFRTNEVHINDGVPDSHEVYGKCPTGLPFNIKVTEKPTMLFEVRCSEQNVQIGGFPWHYIVTPHGCSGWFEVRAVKDDKLATNGELNNASLSIEPDRTFFLGDDSGHILHICEANVRKLQLCLKADSSKCDLREVFSIHLDSHHLPQSPDIHVTASGRRIKKRISLDELTNDCPTVIQDVAYEDDLDLLVISSVTYEPDALIGEVGLYDNQKGNLLRKISLEESASEFYEHHVFLDVDTLVQIVKVTSNKFICTVYKLFGEVDSKQAVKKTQQKCDISSEQRTRQRRGRCTAAARYDA